MKNDATTLINGGCKPREIFKTQNLVAMAMLSAISIVLVMLVRFPLLPGAPWMEYDMADIPILLGGFLIHPLAGLIVCFVVSLIQAFAFAGNGIIGFLMHFCATGAMVITASYIYRIRCNLLTLILGLVFGALTMTAVMIPLNLIFTPIQTGATLEVVKNMLPTVIIPFNLIKSGLNSIVAGFLYFPLPIILKRALKRNG